jgi:hypothetical protein
METKYTIEKTSSPDVLVCVDSESGLHCSFAIKKFFTTREFIFSSENPPDGDIAAKFYCDEMEKWLKANHSDKM